MANVKISQLPAYASGDSQDTDVMPIVDVTNSVTKKMTVQEVRNKILENKISDDAVYIGNPSIDGSFRLFLTGGALKIQKRVSGSWVDRDTIN